MMKSNKKFLGRLTTVSLLLFIAFIYACQTTTDPVPDPDPPVLPDGERVMLIEVFDQDVNPLPGFDIEISGPTSASASNVSGSVYRFEDLEDGVYTIVVTLDDYIEGEITIEVELPEERTAEVTYETSLTLVKKAEPVVINNNEDNEVETAPSDDPEAEEDEKTVMRIPANSIPESALDEDGNVQIRVTRSTPNDVTSDEGGGTVTDNFTLEPDGMVLNNEIEMEIPVNAIPGVNYVLQPGNIPLTAVASKTAQQTGPLANQRTTTRYKSLITEFRRYRVVADISVEKQLFHSEPIQVGEDAPCGQNGQWTYVMPYIVNGNLNTLPEEARKILQHLRKLENESKTFNPSRQNSVPEYKLRALAQNGGFNYRLIQNGSVIEEFTRNVAARFDFISVECHNSGGG